MTAEAIEAGYGGLLIVQGVSIEVRPGEIVTIVGPNGAGKSTFLKALFGLLPVQSGHVHLNGREVTGLPPEAMVRLGAAFVPQADHVFPSMSVEENLELGAYALPSARSGRAAASERQRRLQRVFTTFPILAERRRQRAGTLSGGEQQMLAMGRALMLEPRLLLLDEPTAGLSPKAARQILEKVVEINRQGVSVLMVEQNVRAALALSHRAYLLVMGRNRLSGPAAELLADRHFAEQFLGG